MSTLFYPPAPPDYAAYYGDLLSTAGVLFGLAFAALLFVIQSGFASFQFSRRMFLEVYVKFGRSLLISLAYLTLLALAMLHFPFSPAVFSIVYYLFAVLYAKSVLDHYRQNGYIHTIFSKAFVPASYGPARQYFRYISNLGCATVVGLCMLLFALLVYPIIISIAKSGSWTITQKGFFYSSVLILCHAILRVAGFIPEFFKLSNQELDSAQEPSAARPDDDTSIDYPLERRALKQFLVDHGVAELDALQPTGFLDGELTLDLMVDREGSEAWFNANVSVANPTNVEIRDGVCQHAVRLFHLLAQSKVDINQFVISFHIRIAGEQKSRNMFFRTTRSELESVLQQKDNPVQAATSIDNSLFDEIFRNLQAMPAQRAKNGT